MSHTFFHLLNIYLCIYICLNSYFVPISAVVYGNIKKTESLLSWTLQASGRRKKETMKWICNSPVVSAWRNLKKVNREINGTRLRGMLFYMGWLGQSFWCGEKWAGISSKWRREKLLEEERLIKAVQHLRDSEKVKDSWSYGWWG